MNLRYLICILFILSLAGCAVTTVSTARNGPLPVDPAEREATSVPRASMAGLTVAGRPFIGVALSGGGSRAANFGWAALESLQRQGLLQDLDSISSVSGGSLAAALYALHVDTLKSPEDWAAYRARLRSDFLGDWISRLLRPSNWYKMATSDYERTHAMVEVFDEDLFSNATFEALGPVGRGRPRLLLNATSSTSHVGAEAFLFSHESFRDDLSSRLDTYPISHAVMASGAFPGVFGNITLKIFDEKVFDPVTLGMKPVETYERVYDGGGSDNLGLWTLVARAQAAYLASVRSGQPMKGCMLFAIDAHAPNYAGQKKAFEVNTDHSIVDLIIKSTAWDSIDSLLESNRLKTLQAFGLSYSASRIDPSRKYIPFLTPLIRPRTGRRFTNVEWRGMYEPVVRFKLFQPVLPWDRTRAWPGKHEGDQPRSGVEAAAAYKREFDKFAAAKESAPECLLWHLTFERLQSMADYQIEAGRMFSFSVSEVFDTIAFRKDRAAQESDVGEWSGGRAPFPPDDVMLDVEEIGQFRDLLWATATNLKTNYRLTGPKSCSPEFLQRTMVASASVLIEEDASALGQVCAWYRQMGLNTQCRVSERSKRRLSAMVQPWQALFIGSNKRDRTPIVACEELDQKLFPTPEIGDMSKSADDLGRSPQ